MIRVTNLDEALRAVEEIVNQGEGRQQVRDSTTSGAPKSGMLGPSFEYIAPAAAANAA